MKRGTPRNKKTKRLAKAHLGVSDRTLYRYVAALRAAFGEGTIERRQDGLTAHFDASAWGQA